MRYPIKVHTEDGLDLILNEEQISSIEGTDSGNARIRMSNGDVWVVDSPKHVEWENDCLRRLD